MPPNVTTVHLSSNWLRNYVKEFGGVLCIAKRLVIAG